jgi:uncharacterized membrane protein YbhN (UPF0104 family)
LVLVTPGGLGVRESMMFFIIKGVVKNNDVALVVPVATRLLTMTIDIALGITAFFLGNKTVFKNEFTWKSRHKI